MVMPTAGGISWATRVKRASFVGIGAAVVASWVVFLALMPTLRTLVGMI